MEIKKINAQIPRVSTHRPLPELLFLTTHSRILGPPAMAKKVLTATTSVQSADPSSPAVKATAWKLQYAPGWIALILSQ